MKIKYLGTAAAEGWPGIFCHCGNCEEARRLGGKDIRTRAQVLINEDLMMDFGPDTYMHSLLQNVDLAKLETVLLTHSHTDHFYPSELILRGIPYAFDLDKKPLVLYGNEKCRQILKRTEEFENDSPTFSQCVKFEPASTFCPISKGGYEILPLAARHDDSEKCMIYSVRDSSGKRLLYGNDTGMFPEETWERMKGLYFDVVSLDCTMGIKEGGYGHMSFEENLKVKQRMTDMGCADQDTIFISTHFSHTCGLPHDEFQQKADNDQVCIAYDGMELEV